ncbi:MAG: hypothetical protein V7742_14150 [Halioglobus sp.]
MSFSLTNPHPIKQVLPAVLLIVLCAGCTSIAPTEVDTVPFTQFSASLQGLRDGSDAQAQATADASRQEIIAGVASGNIKPPDLQLEFAQSNPYATSYGFADNVNFTKLDKFTQGLKALNAAIVGYAQSIATLAGGAEKGDILPTADEFDQAAIKLNTNAGTAASALGLNADPDKQALLSVVAVQLFKGYIENKRREELGKAIDEVQPQIKAFSTAAQNAVQFLAEMVETDYNKKILPLITTPDAKPILTLNDTTQATLATLESLSNSYGALPAAHRDLSAVASKKTTGLAGLTALVDEARRLRGLVKKLAETNEAALLIPPEGDSQ